VLVGSVPPDGTDTHAPCEPGTLQDWQVPLQRPLQQTPCEQKLLAHSMSRAHSAPWDFLPQEFCRQVCPVAQSRLVAQLVPQRLPPHL
jgi:hypothetical protein